MRNHPQLLLLRRPLPPKLPKLPLYKKVRTVTTDKIELPQAKFPQDERDRTRFHDTVSRKQLQTSVGIHTLSFDDRVQKAAATVSVTPKSKPNRRWHIPDTATGCAFFPTCPSASTRVFGKETKQVKRSKKPKGEPSKMKKTSSVDDILKDMLIFSSMFSKPTSAPPSVTPHIPKDVLATDLPLSKSRAYTVKQPLIDLSVVRPASLPGVIPMRAQSLWFGHFQPSAAALLNITHFPGALPIPPPVLPRKPRRQSEIETRKTEIENLEDVQSFIASREGLIKSRKPNEAEAQVKRRELYKTVVTTQYEAIQAMSNLAVINCHIYGRNALSLKGFFILKCPDLTSLALQLIYLNLSFNDISSFPTEVFCLKYLQILILRNNPIKAIPSEIQQLRFLRVFNIAFNLILSLPPGLFYLPYLEELNISYNNIAVIPNEIQKLRSLKQFNVDGNDLTSFPPGILKLNLKRIQFDNNFTHPYLWKENSLNSPQCLTHVVSLFFLKNNLHRYYDVIPAKIQVLLKCTSKCEWCEGPRFGEGYRVIQSRNVFGAARLPIMFRVCSSSCYRAVNENSVF